MEKFLPKIGLESRISAFRLLGLGCFSSENVRNCFAIDHFLAWDRSAILSSVTHDGIWVVPFDMALESFRSTKGLIWFQCKVWIVRHRRYSYQLSDGHCRKLYSPRRYFFRLLKAFFHYQKNSEFPRDSFRCAATALSARCRFYAPNHNYRLPN